MDTKEIKLKFPIFKNKVNGKQLVYLDSANSSQKPKTVIERISKFYSKEFSNICGETFYFNSLGPDYFINAISETYCDHEKAILFLEHYENQNSELSFEDLERDISSLYIVIFFST